jgi:hypothetical protein
MPTFSFRGGVWSPKGGVTEKFLLFLIVSGKEISLNSAQSYGLVNASGKSSAPGNSITVYETAITHAKIFLAETAIRRQRRFNVFYVQFDDATRETITVRPYSCLYRDPEKDAVFPGQMIFKFNGKVLNGKEVESITSGESLSYYRNQSAMPIMVKDRVVSVDRSNVPRRRFVRINGG